MVSERWSVADMRTLCDEGVGVTRGPLNATYLVNTDHGRFFVRERLIHDDEYGQTFAAERYVHEYFDDTCPVRVPRVRGIVADHAGIERFAIFDAIDGSEVAWSAPEDIEALIAVLLATHAVPGPGLGNVRGPHSPKAVQAYMQELLEAEVARIVPNSPMMEDLDRLQSVTPLAHVFMGEPICLCHGDVHARNFMRESTGEFWTVDWEAARFRVAAADFNQLHYRWLTREASEAILVQYANASGRDPEKLSIQVDYLRLLWHVRTFNFETALRGRPFHDTDLTDHVKNVDCLLRELNQAMWLE